MEVSSIYVIALINPLYFNLTCAVIFIRRQGSRRKGVGSTQVYSNRTHKGSYRQRKTTVELGKEVSSFLDTVKFRK